MKHGFAIVVYPFDVLDEGEIYWEPNFEIDGINYPIVERTLNLTEREKISKIIDDFESRSYLYSYECNDGYSYFIYFNDKKVASTMDFELTFEDISPKFKKNFEEIISMAEPLYPNYGVETFYYDDYNFY